MGHDLSNSIHLGPISISFVPVILLEEQLVGKCDSGFSPIRTR